MLEIGNYFFAFDTWTNCRQKKLQEKLDTFYNLIEFLPELAFILQALTLPSAAFEPRLRGSFRRLTYSRQGGDTHTQEMMAYKVISLLSPVTTHWDQFGLNLVKIPLRLREAV